MPPKKLVQRMTKECPHENISVNMVYENGKRKSSETVCDDCKQRL